MKKSIKLIGVAAILLALVACSDDADDAGACLIDMSPIYGADIRTCTTPSTQETCDAMPGGEYKSSCPSGQVCSYSLEGGTVYAYGSDVDDDFCED
jgi:hypothetical protein